MKKILSVILSVMLVFGISVTAFAAEEEETVLKFNDDGKFTIIHLTDIQDGYPMYDTTREFIKEVLAENKPDLVVLGGDNTVGEKETKAQAIEELCNLFVESETYFTLVFGNHDHQQGVDKETLLALYQQYGGKYCLAYDAVPELFGVGTHNLPIMSSDGSKVAYNLYMIDSNTYYPEEENSLGYDAVHTDEIEWYKSVAAELKEANGGEVVPAMVFQHIIVQEIYDELFIESPVSLGVATQEFMDTDGTKHYYTYLPKVANIEDGYLFEQPCPGYYNYGQLDACVETGDVKAIFTGHDHTNNFTVNIDGIDIINSGGCTFNSYGNDLNRGCRFIILDENDTSTYETYTYTVAEQALKEGSTVGEYGDITKTAAAFAKIGDVFLSVLMTFVKAIFCFIK